MAVKKILLYPKDKEALRVISESIHAFNNYTRHLIKDLKDTLIAHEYGVGLAAPQINVHNRVVVVRLSAGSQNQGAVDLPIALINPKIIDSGEERRDFDGCLSFPGLYAHTVRPHYLRVTFYDENGYFLDRVFKDFDAVVVHHEIDHLDGVLFIDRCRSLDDLYRVYIDNQGNPIQVAVSEILQLEKKRSSSPVY